MWHYNNNNNNIIIIIIIIIIYIMIIIYVTMSCSHIHYEDLESHINATWFMTIGMRSLYGRIASYIMHININKIKHQK